MKLPLLLASVAAMAAPPPPVAQPAPVRAPAPVRLPGFAAELAQSAPLASPTAWSVIAADAAWRDLAAASGLRRQEARWAYALSLIGRGRGPEALGVLQVMAADDPDLAMVDAWRLAHGAALTLSGRSEEAAATLAGGALATNPEACAWRLRAASDVGLDAQAIGSVACAQPALRARPVKARRPFLIAAARAALDGSRPDLAFQWLGGLPDRDPVANLYRGRAQGMMGLAAEARLRLARVERSGTVPERIDARLSMIELAAANGWVKPATAIQRLDRLRYGWRGDRIEERALRLGYQLAGQTGDTAVALETGATLYRFFDPVRQGLDFLPNLQGKLAAALEPDAELPIDRAAGLFWDYRDLIPGGAAGDLMVSRFGARLQSAGLYGRAAELFEHQLLVRATDLTQGPLSVKVATLYILAGRPERAETALRKTDKADYPAPMLFARKRVEAVALSQLGRPLEAFAVLQGVPDAAAIQAEIAWKRRDWAGVAAGTAHQLPTGAELSDVGQAIVLRRAIALAMLGQENELAGLHARYAEAFGRLPNGAVFTMLTSAPGSVDPARLAQAMAAMPAASPAGDLAELIEAGR
jgi:hypothetical protein